MPAIASPYFDDPQMGEIAQNIFTALRGRPEEDAKVRYLNAETRAKQNQSDLFQLQADRLARSNYQQSRLGQIFDSRQGIDMPAPPRIPYDVDPNAITEGDIQTGPYRRPPTAAELAQADADELIAYGGASDNPEQFANARRSITALPFLTSGNADKMMAGSLMLGHPVGDNQFVNTEQQAIHAKQDYDKTIAQENVKGRWDYDKEGLSQGQQNWRFQRTPVTTQAGASTAFYPGDPRAPSGSRAGPATTDTLRASLAQKIAAGKATQGEIATFNQLNAASRTGGGRTPGKVTLKQGELDKIKLDALATVKGAVTQQGTKEFINQDFVNAVGPERMRAGEAAMNEALKMGGTPADAADAFREAAGLTNSTFAAPSWWEFGENGLTDNNDAAAGPPAPTLPPQGDAPVGKDPSQVKRAGNKPGIGRVYEMMDGSVLDAKGNPVGKAAAQPPQQQGAKVVANEQPQETEAGYGGTGGIFTAQAMDKTQVDAPPVTAEVFTPQKSIHQARGDTPYVPDAWTYTDLSQAQRDAGDITLPTAQRVAANEAVARLQGIGPQKRPQKAAPLKTTFINAHDANVALSRARYGTPEWKEASAFLANMNRE